MTSEERALKYGRKGRVVSPRTEEQKKELSDRLKKYFSRLTPEERSIKYGRFGRENWRKTHPVLDSTRKKTSDALKGHMPYTLTPEISRHISEGQKKRGGWNVGPKNWNWKGGITKLESPYSEEFSEKLKKSIRKRDNIQCQLCGEAHHHKVLDVHHIDYNKLNCDPVNLITLCRSCHARTLVNRIYWTALFQARMIIRGTLALTDFWEGQT